MFLEIVEEINDDKNKLMDIKTNVFTKEFSFMCKSRDDCFWCSVKESYSKWFNRPAYVDNLISRFVATSIASRFVWRQEEQ